MLHWMILLLVVLGPSASACARPQGAASAGSGANAADTGTATAEVDVEVLQLGVGNLARPGEWVGVQIGLADRAAKVRTLALRLSVVDADGDTAAYQTLLAANPGAKQRTWLYVRLPFNAGPTMPLHLSVHEADEGASGASGGGPESPGVGRVVGSKVFFLQNPVPFTSGLVAVVGRAMAGLDQYSVRHSSDSWAPLGHELTEKPAQLRVADLPDRWLGLMQFDALVWTATGTDGEPGDLTESQAEAVREWVQRGGHLVVVLPATGTSWMNATSNPLLAILPRAAVKRIENASLEPYRGFLLRPPSKPDAALPTMPSGVGVNVLIPAPDAEVGEADRVLVGADGTCFVARRTVGTGAVTLVGIDLTARPLSALNLPPADVFWHRVLGRRGKLPTNEEVALMVANRSGVGGLPGYMSARAEKVFDRSIAGQIAKTGRAGTGVLLGFGIFIAYWLVAGPLGFAVLKKRKWVHHAWVSFVLAAGAFTALAWGGATALRPGKLEGSHLTFLDHVAGQRVERARSWVGLLLPKYGQMRIEVAADATEPMRASVASWDPPTDSRGGSGVSFPDARTYVVNGRNPSSITAPTRSTVKQVQVDWSGGPRWKMPIPVGLNSAGQTEPVSGRDAIRPAAANNLVSRLEGLLVHELPAPMTDVTLVYVPGQNLRVSTSAGNLLSSAVAWRLSGQWAAGQVLDLAETTLTGRGPSSDPVAGLTNGPRPELAESLLTALVPASGGLSNFGPDRSDANEAETQFASRMLGLALFPLLGPPEPLAGSNLMDAVSLARRRATHGYDVARWFTQPCLIIIGHVGTAEAPAPCPLPLTVDGGEVPVLGKTIVRWVYPLPDNPPVSRDN